MDSDLNSSRVPRSQALLVNSFHTASLFMPLASVIQGLTQGINSSTHIHAVVFP